MSAKQTPLVDLLRMHADDIHSAHGHNKSSTLLSRAADRITALEADRDQLREELAEVRRDNERLSEIGLITADALRLIGEGKPVPFQWMQKKLAALAADGEEQ